MKKSLFKLVLSASLIFSPLAFAADDASVVANQVDLMNQANELQQQVQTLQGQLEELTHTVQTLQTQSASQYSDLDQRLSKLEGGKKSSPQQPVTDDSTAAPVSSAAEDDAAALPAAPASTPAAAAPAAENPNDEQAYQAAYNKVKKGDYTTGITAMRKFLTQYPNSTYAPNAHYWLGQMYLLKSKGAEAAAEFNTVLKQYPQDTKAKDAALKLGFAYLLQNKNAQAKAQFKKVMRLYPGTAAAQLAESRLAQMP